MTMPVAQAKSNSSSKSVDGTIQFSSGSSELWRSSKAELKSYVKAHKNAKSFTVIGNVTKTSVAVNKLTGMSSYALYGSLCQSPQFIAMQVTVGTKKYYIYPPKCDQPWIDWGRNGIQAGDASVTYSDPWGRSRGTGLDANRVIPLIKQGTGIEVTFNTSRYYQITVATTDGNLSEPPVGSPTYTLGNKSVGSKWIDTDSTTLPARGNNRWYVVDYQPLG